MWLPAPCGVTNIGWGTSLQKIAVIIITSGPRSFGVLRMSTTRRTHNLARVPGFHFVPFSSRFHFMIQLSFFLPWWQIISHDYIIRLSCQVDKASATESRRELIASSNHRSGWRLYKSGYLAAVLLCVWISGNSSMTCWLGVAIMWHGSHGELCLQIQKNQMELHYNSFDSYPNWQSY